MRHKVNGLVFALVAAVLVLGGATGTAQQRSGREGVFTDSIDVEVANIEVFVTDRRGWAVDGLDASDFELEVDGQPVEIVNFLVVNGGEAVINELPPAAEAGQQEGTGEKQPAEVKRVVRTVPAPQQALNLVIYLDFVFLRNDSMRIVIPEITGFLSKQLTPGSRVMLVAYNGRTNTIVPFTEDVSAVIQGIEELRTKAGHGQLFDSVQTSIINRLGWALAHPDPQMTAGEMISDLLAETDAAAEDLRMLIQSSWRGMQGIVDSLSSGLVGKKAILYVSDGIPLTPYRALYQGITGAEIPPNGLPIEMRRVMRHANANGVIIYTVNAGGVSQHHQAGVAPPDVPGFVAYHLPDAPREMAFKNDADHIDTMQVISLMTGGLTIRKPTPDTLKAIAQDFGSYYSLGFIPPAVAEARQCQVKVKVKKKGITARHRKTILATTGQDRLVARAFAALEVDLQDNPLGLTWELGEHAADAADADGETVKGEHGFKIPLAIKVPSDRLTLIPGAEGVQGQLRLLIVSKEGNTRVSPITDLTLPIKLSQDPQERENPPVIAYRTEVQLQPGNHTLAITMLDEVAKVISSRSGKAHVDRKGLTTFELSSPGLSSWRD